jgi:hypothetical protein
VDLAAQTIANRKLRSQLGSVSRGHAHGRPLWREMQEAGIAPIASKLVRAGEEGGRLAETLGELAEYYDEETSYSVDNYEPARAAGHHRHHGAGGTAGGRRLRAHDVGDAGSDRVIRVDGDRTEGLLDTNEIRWTTSIGVPT